MRRVMIASVVLAAASATNALAQVPVSDFTGTVKSGTEFPKPLCPAGTEPVIVPVMPDLVARQAGNQRAAVFYRETQGGGVIHLQTKEGKGSWQDVTGISVHYQGDCHP